MVSIGIRRVRLEHGETTTKSLVVVKTDGSDHGFYRMALLKVTNKAWYLM